MSPSASELIELLGLAPHPEGGWFRETHRGAALPFELPGRGRRASSTAIYFLLPAGEFSALHRVASDESWHHYLGSSLELVMLDQGGKLERRRLGKDVAHGELPQALVPAGVLQAATALGPDYALVGCCVAPGFEFADFEMPTAAELAASFPEHEALIRSLTRS